MKVRHRGVALVRPEAAALGFAANLEETMDGPVEDLTVDFLSWLSSGPKPYAEVMEAWRTSCPRLMIWEEAIEACLVVRQSGGAEGPSVALTDEGRAWLAAHRALAV